MSDRSAGGMLIAWKLDLYELLSIEYGIYTRSVKLSNCNTGFPVWISCIYGPSSNRGKDEFWTELYDLGNSMVFGDFNEVLYSEDRNVRRGSAPN